MTQKPQLSRIAAAGIKELRTEHGVEPTLDEIIWLHELGKVQERAGHVDGILDAPAQAGNTFLWPVTIMSAQWYRNYATVWYDKDPGFSFYALAFALAHGHGEPILGLKQRGWAERIIRSTLDIQEHKTLADLLDRREATRAIEYWAGRIQATRRELEQAVDFVLAAADEENKEQPTMPGVNYDDMIHELAICSGTDPDYWRSRTSQDATIRAFINLMAIERARRGITGPSPRDALGDAIHNFRKAIVAIIDAHKEAGCK